jgi:FkbM family methyltransferase
MIPEFSESKRYDYPLGPQSIVIDAGMFHGNFARLIHEKYGCIVLGFEPVKRWFDMASEACANTRRITLFNCGLGGHFRYETFAVQGDSTGMYAGSEDKEKVIIMEAVPHLRQIHKGKFDLFKINIEQMEFELLEHIMAENAAGMFKAIQVQFHFAAPDAERRYAAIAEGLSKTHHLTWRTPWVWENWEANQ